MVEMMAAKKDSLEKACANNVKSGMLKINLPLDFEPK